MKDWFCHYLVERLGSQFQLLDLLLLWQVIAQSRFSLCSFSTVGRGRVFFDTIKIFSIFSLLQDCLNSFSTQLFLHRNLECSPPKISEINMSVMHLQEQFMEIGNGGCERNRLQERRTQAGVTSVRPVGMAFCLHIRNSCS